MVQESIDLLAPSEEHDIALDRELTSRGMRHFVRVAWDRVVPNPLVETFHVDAICEHLQAVGEGQIKNLLINIPPGCSKSVLTCVLWTPYEWIRSAKSRWLYFAYDKMLSGRDSVATRDLITSRWFRMRWPHVQLKPRQNQKTYYVTTAGGYRMSTTTQGRATGEHPHFIVGDDPHDVRGAESTKKREGDIEWWDQTLSSRGLSLGVRRVVIMQRLHEKDLSGHVLGDVEGEWEHLMLPMRYEKSRAKVTSIGFSDPRKNEGELLAPRLLPDPIVRGLERRLGPYGTAGQLQQRPHLRQGAMFKVERLQVIPASEYNPKRAVRVLRSWDKAGTKDAGCYTVGTLWVQDIDERIILADLARGQWSTDEVENQMDLWSRLDELKYGRLKAETVFEKEPGASGVHSAKMTLKRLRGRRVRAIDPLGSKVVRAEPLATAMNMHEIYVVEGSWLSDYMAELRAFPNSEFADQVDASSLGYNEITSPADWMPPDDDEDGDPTDPSGTSKIGESACANPRCDRMAGLDAEYCCSCCRSAADAGSHLAAGDHSPECNSLHGQLYAKGKWEPAGRVPRG